MRGNEARPLILEDQINENLMEARFAVIEKDITRMQEDARKLYDDLQAANDAITKLKTGHAELKGQISVLRAELRGESGILRAEMGALARR